MAKYINIKNAELVYKNYAQNNSIAIIAIDKETRETLCVCTACLPEAHLEEGEVLIKNYSENEGVLEDLVDMGIISSPTNLVPSGFINLHVCKLLKHPEK